jgi:predicted SAM-dependent methyltransferase
MKCLNLGCGWRFHPGWENLDIHPVAAEVKAWDLHRDLPYPEATFDVVYHSHVLEHFSRGDGLCLLQRCFRVLRPGGTIRVAVPNLENIARLYLEALDKSLSGDPVWRQRYEWILLEMYDQTVRETSGGEMLAYLQRNPMPEEDFVSERIGGELKRAIGPQGQPPINPTRPKTPSVVGNFLRRKLARLALGRDGIRAHDIGRFRASGEIHLWMYDAYSLANALQRAEFLNSRQCSASESAILNWSEFHLDTEADGTVYKPDSLYMEAVRP